MQRSIFSRKALLAAIIGLLAVSGTQLANADEDRHVFLRFAGDFTQNFEQADAVNAVPTGTTSLSGVVRAKAKGNLGRADLTAVTRSKGVEPAPEPVWDDRCPDLGIFVKVADITDNTLVFTFSDLSLLYGDGNGVVCINILNGEQYVAVEGVWLGGTGRFRNAEGEFSIRFDEAVTVNTNTQVVAETGTLRGTLRRSD